MYCQTPQIKWWYDVKDMSFGNSASADIDKDGYLEIVFSCYRNDSCIYVLNAEDGSLLWKYNTGGCNDAAPLIYDVDNDDTLDIILTSSCVPKTFCINGITGTVKWVANSNGSDSPPTLGDVDNDNKPDILFGEFGGTVRCLNADVGTLKWVLNVDSNSWIQTEPILLDLDNNSQLDFVIANYNFDTAHRIFAYNAYDLSLLWETSLPNDVMYHGASFADIDNDQKPELAIGSYDGNLYVLNGEDGSLKFDFSLPNAVYVGAPTSIADLNNDGFYEIVFVDNYTISAVTHIGELLWSYEIPSYATAFRGAAISDINDDGILDVIFGTSKGNVIALTGSSGGLIWNIDLASHYGASFDIDHGPIIADFDMDGYLDIFVIGGYAEYPDIQKNYGRAYAISTEGKGGPDWLMFRRDLTRSACIPISTTGIDELNTSINISPNPAIDFINININNLNMLNLQIKICDILGNEMYCQIDKNQPNYTIDLSNFAQGVYIILINNNGKTLTNSMFIKL